MSTSGGIGDVSVVLAVVGSLLGLVILGVRILRRAAPQLREDAHGNTTLEEILARTAIDEPEMQRATARDGDVQSSHRS